MEVTEKAITCKHAESVGASAVFVKPTCPHLHMIKGRLVASRWYCRSKCTDWEAKDAKHKH